MKKILKAIGIFAASLLILLGLLWLAVQIPQNAIKDNTYESAKSLCEIDLFQKIIPNVENTKVDRYADSILLGINYQMDGSLSQLMWSSYYSDSRHNESNNLLYAIEQSSSANLQYLRYWHGSIMVLRPLLVFFDINQIYIINAVIMTVLIMILLIILAKNRLYIEACAILAGSILTSLWVVPLSLEYTWTMLIMLITTIVAVKWALAGKKDKLVYLFIVAGVVTNFFDFLTTETLTLTVPMLMSLSILVKRENYNQGIGFVIKNSIAWLVGYATTWCMKWLIAAMVLGENTWQYITEHVSERLAGDVGVSLGENLIGAVWRNIACLFPMQYGVIGRIVALLLVIALAYVAYVYKGERINYKLLILLFIIGMIPYVRYLIIHNHSYLHCFFTYRAQLATIIVAILAVDVLVEGRWPLLDRFKHSDALPK